MVSILFMCGYNAVLLHRKSFKLIRMIYVGEKEKQSEKHRETTKKETQNWTRQLGEVFIYL